MDRGRHVGDGIFGGGANDAASDELLGDNSSIDSGKSPAPKMELQGRPTLMPPTATLGQALDGAEESSEAQISGELGWGGDHAAAVAPGDRFEPIDLLCLAAFHADNGAWSDCLDILDAAQEVGSYRLTERKRLETITLGSLAWHARVGVTVNECVFCSLRE